jgi:hypothetical protein
MYVKLFSSLYQGTLRGNSHGILVFTNLLAHCDREGVADIHPKAIAEEVGLSVELVRAALDELEAPDIESRSPDEGGRRIVRVDEHRAWGWRIVNYAKYRAIKNEDDRREANRIAVAKHRAARAVSSPVIIGNAKSSVKAQGEGEGEGEERNTGSGAALRAAPPPPAFDGKNSEHINGRATVPIAVGWELPEAWGVDAEALGWKPAVVLFESEKFRQYWTAGKGSGTRRTVRGWRQSWSNWLGKAAERAQR